MQIKPILAGGLAGVVAAVGGVAAFDATQSADAQNSSNSSLQAQINQLNNKVDATDKRSIVAGKKGNAAWNGQNRYTAPQGTVPPALKTPKITQQGYVGGGWQPNALDDDVQKNWPYWVKVYYNGTTLSWQGRGITDVQREAPGVYRVYAGTKNLAACNYTATPGYYNGGEPDKYARVQIYNGNATNNVLVRTYEADKPGNADVVAKDYAWQGQIVCNPPSSPNGAAPTS